MARIKIPRKSTAIGHDGHVRRGFPFAYLFHINSKIKTGRPAARRCSRLPAIKVNVPDDGYGYHNCRSRKSILRGRRYGHPQVIT